MECNLQRGPLAKWYRRGGDHDGAPPQRQQALACSRFIGAKSNALVDGLVCSYDLGDRAVQITNAILAKIAG